MSAVDNYVEQNAQIHQFAAEVRELYQAFHRCQSFRQRI